MNKKEVKKITKKMVIEAVKSACEVTRLHIDSKFNKYNCIDYVCEVIDTIDKVYGRRLIKSTAFSRGLKFLKGVELDTMLENTDDSIHYIELSRIKKGEWSVIIDGTICKSESDIQNKLVNILWTNKYQVSGFIDLLDDSIIHDVRDIANSEYFNNLLNSYIKNNAVCNSNSNKDAIE